MQAAKEKEIFTTDYIYSLPDGERAELIDGEIYFMAPPMRRHQRLVHFFDKTIGNYIDEKGGKCEVYPAPFAVFLNEDEYTYVEPDISVICSPEKLNDKGCFGAPDWIIEVVSPSSRIMDYYKKLFKYKEAGVREYWICDPDKNIITVYSFEKETMEQYPFGAEIPAAIYPDFILKTKKLENLM